MTDALDLYAKRIVEKQDEPDEPDDSDDTRPRRLLAAAKALLSSIDQK